MRIAVGGISHESNTFVPGTTALSDFEPNRVAGNDLIDRWRDTHHELAGFIAGGEEHGYDPYPLSFASATPGGPVDDDALDALISDLVHRLSAAPPLDGMLLALHGAMSAVGFPDGDAEVIRRIRANVGRDFPLIVTHDFHANVSNTTADLVDALVIYQTNPHVDQRERGLLAAEIAAMTARGEVQPMTAVARPPMMWPILHQNTSADPLSSVLKQARQLEGGPGILAVSPYAGFPYADVWEVGCGCVVVADGELEPARQVAGQFANKLWSLRKYLDLDLPDAEQSVRRAIATDQTPVVLVDFGDNIGGGTAGDHTLLLEQLLHQDARGFLVTLYDPLAVEECQHVGVGGEVSLHVGGHHDVRAGHPVPITGKVLTLHDGSFEETEPRHGGGRLWNQGDTAVIELAHDNLLLLNSKRTPPFSLHQLTSVGIDPAGRRIIVVKAAIAYRAAYEPIAGEIIEVDTPGAIAVNPVRFDYHHARRPLWPLQ